MIFAWLANKRKDVQIKSIGNYKIIKVHESI